MLMTKFSGVGKLVVARYASYHVPAHMVKRPAQAAEATAAAAEDVAVKPASKEEFVELDVEYDRDDPAEIGDLFSPPPPLENVDLDAELDMRSEEVITAEDFEPLHDDPLGRPVDLDAEFDMSSEDAQEEEDSNPPAAVSKGA